MFWISLRKPWWRKPTTRRVWLMSVPAGSTHGWGLHRCTCNIQWVCMPWDQVISNFSAHSCFWVTQNQQRWQNFSYFWTDFCCLQHEVPSDSACFSCLSCEYFAAAADQPGEGGRPSCSQSHSIAFCFYSISSLHGQMLGRIEPAPCILMCFFSDHSSFAEDMPLATSAPRNITG